MSKNKGTGLTVTLNADFSEALEIIEQLKAGHREVLNTAVKEMLTELLEDDQSPVRSLLEKIALDAVTEDVSRNGPVSRILRG